MNGQLRNLTSSHTAITPLRHSHARCVKIPQTAAEGSHESTPWAKHLLGTAHALLLLATCSVIMCIPAKASTPLPDDLQLVATNCLPTHASWYSVQRWGHYPPSLVNWCAG